MSKRRLEEAEVEDVDVRDDEEEEEEEPAAAAGEDGAASSPTSPGGAGKRKEDAGRYQFLACVREDHGKAIYSVAFAPRGEHQNYFATIGANRVSDPRALMHLHKHRTF